MKSKFKLIKASDLFVIQSRRVGTNAEIHQFSKEIYYHLIKSCPPDIVDEVMGELVLIWESDKGEGRK